MKTVRSALFMSLMLMTLSLASCSKILYAPMYQTGSVSHVVVCTLKNHGNEADRNKLIEAARELRKVNGVADIEVGTCLPSDRPIVAGDYDVAMIVFFRDESYMKKYLADPEHQRLTKEVLEPLTSKVVVYDILNRE